MRRTWQLIVVVTMVATACTAAGSDPGIGDAGDGAAAPTTAPTTTAPATTTVAPATVVPTTTSTVPVYRGIRIENFIPGALIGPETREQAGAMEREAEEFTAACMAQRGYEYVPFVPDDGMLLTASGFDEGYAARYGFGIVRDLFGDTYLDEELTGEEDPNIAIVEAMTPAEQDAYFASLYGQGPAIDAETMTQDEINAAYDAYVTDGCMDLAQQQVYGGGSTDSSGAFYEEFGDELEAFHESMKNDPRYASVDAIWSTCMADLGYEFGEEADAYVYVHDELLAVGAIQDGPDGTFGYVALPVEPGSELEAQVDAIAAEEVEIALASVGCSDHTWRLLETLRRESELQFIAEYRDELEQFKADHTP